MTAAYKFLEVGDVIKLGDEIYLAGVWCSAYSHPGEKWTSQMHTVRRRVS